MFYKPAMDMLVSTEWLADELDAPDLRLLDATYFALDPSRDPRAEYDAAHIPGAIYMDLQSLKDPENPVPFMLPPAEIFASRMRALGIGDGDRVILYDNSVHRTSARAWWMLTSFGARNVAVLDGGFAKWIAEGRPVSTAQSDPAPGHFTPHFDAGGLRTKIQVLAGLDGGAEQLVDARGAARFTGAECDPRPEVAPGHIPGSRNLPYDRLFEADGRWKRGRALEAAFEEAGVDLKRPLIMTCGSGVTASVLLFGARLLGKDDVSLYDGSWSEWGIDPATPKAVGPA